MMWDPRLTEHQTVVLQLLARGHTYTQIAGILTVDWPDFRPEAASVWG